VPNNVSQIGPPANISVSTLTAFVSHGDVSPFAMVRGVTTLFMYFRHQKRRETEMSVMNFADIVARRCYRLGDFGWAILLSHRLPFS